MFEELKKSIYVNFIERNRYLFVLEGLKLTLILTVACFIATVLLGALLCAGIASKQKWLRNVVNVYNSIVNKIPPLVLLMLFSYVIFKNSSLESVYIAFIGLTIRQASTMADIFYSGLSSVKKGEVDAARTLGMSKGQAFFHVTLPQATRAIIPLLKTQFVLCMQNTSVVSMLGVMDLTRAVNVISIQTFDPYISVITSTVVYLLIGYLGDLIINVLTKKKHLSAKENTL